MAAPRIRRPRTPSALLLLVLAGCAGVQHGSSCQPTGLADGAPFRHAGFTAALPPRPDWCERTDLRSTSRRYFGYYLEPAYAVAAIANTEFFRAEEQDGVARDLAGLGDEERLDAVLAARRFRDTRPGRPTIEVVAWQRHRASPPAVTLDGAACAEYRVEYLDRAFPGHVGEPFRNVARSLVCIHPKTRLPIELIYVQVEPAAGERFGFTFEQEANAFFGSLRFP